ncbi:1993_t:CDS:2 [Ambispora gerdemannii]|uniref:1993_t:CDS:1 n=1 Tax=Ambispora gerdemannii TaxID=144530 RepID=A0A9N9DHW3_9GLOM|nr:1993_t:CDS:2 [Ambispora gerdemannii]
MSNPSIVIDPSESRKFDISIDLQKIYYHPSGYQRTSKKLYEISQKARFDFTLAEVQEWLERQALHQIHMPHPKYIPCVSFNNITVPFEVLQADILYMPYDKIGDITYMFYEDEFSLEGILTSAVVAETFERMLFNDLECFITWDMIKLVITDKGSEFKSDFEKLLRKHNVKNQKANFKSTMDIVENFNGTFDQEFEKKNIRTILKLLNNTITRLIGMTPNEASKKKHVYAKFSKPRNGPMEFDEERLPHDASVRYLLKPGELEGGRRRATDYN